MKKLLIPLLLLFLTAACTSDPSLLVKHNRILKVTSITSFSDTTSLFYISAFGKGSFTTFIIEKKNGFANVGDPIDLVNLTDATVPAPTITPVKKDTVNTNTTNKNLK